MADAVSTITPDFSTKWTFLRFDDGKATNVRILRGSPIIEVQIKGRKKLFDLTEYLLLENTKQVCNNNGGQ